ncbi:MAG: IS256 family transposase [Patescibacteria group bacterium]
MYTTHKKFNKSNPNAKPAKLPVFNDSQDLQAFLQRNLEESLKQLIKVSVTTMVRAEMESLRAEMPEPPAFNGHYPRQLTSPFGRIEDVPVPRFRQGFSPDCQPQTLGVFETEQQRFLKVVGEMHRMGISQRKVKELAKLCFGKDISTTTIGSIHKELAEAEEAKLNSRSLYGIPYAYLIVDGIWAKAKGYGWEGNEAVLLCAVGMKDDGTKDILGFKVARAEDEESWQRFLASLLDRGLDKTSLKLAIADDGAGFRAAKGKLLPNVPLQVCIVHKMRNVMMKASRKHRTAVIAGLKDIYASTTKDAATTKAKALIKQWYASEPKAMESLRYHFEDTVAYLDFPKEYWSKLRTSNTVERLFREVRRRMKVMDNSFNSTDSMGNYGASILGNLQEVYMR